ncbi:MAG TPA: CocE/NonD family hydrolase [Thermoleophilaceae bacterium]|nr:CocE/NonD family hydrolase [Thermoleophilaceae bacterium]
MAVAPQPSRRDRLSYVRDRLAGILRPRVSVSEPPAGAVASELDVAVPMRDGVVLRVNVYRPPGDEPVPAIMSAHPYGKDVLPRRGRRGRWRFSPQYRAFRQPQPVAFSSLTGWEAPDPAWWVARGYAVVNCDLRGCGTSDGTGDLLTAKEGEDYHDLIEWAAVQPWCTGKVGLLGVSYLAISQYEAAATRPPHLAAICPWEGFSDPYRDLMRPGGVREDGFVRVWSRGVRKWRLTSDVRAGQVAHELCDEWWQARTPTVERIEAPMLVCASFSDHNLHSHGSFRAFEQAGSRQKWLYTHRGGKWATFYSADALAAQRRFFDHFLKGEDNGQAEQSPVRLEVRSDRDTVVEVRQEQEWPLRATDWTELRLSADGRLIVGGAEPAGASEPGAHERDGHLAEGAVRFETDSGVAIFRRAFAERTELSGPMALRLHVSIEGGDDADLHVRVHKVRDGRAVPFEGSYGYGLDGVTTGWLRISQRELDVERSRPFEPVHTHARRLPLAPGEIAPVEIALMPSATLFEAGDELVLEVHGRWPKPRNPITGQFPAWYERRPAVRCALHCGGERDARLLVPVIRRASG